MKDISKFFGTSYRIFKRVLTFLAVEAFEDGGATCPPIAL